MYFQRTPPPSSPPGEAAAGRPIVSSKGRICRNNWDAALDDLPTSKIDPLPNDEELDKYFLSTGVPPHRLETMRREYDYRMNEFIRLGGGSIPVIGVSHPPDLTGGGSRFMLC